MDDREKVIKGLEHCRKYGRICGMDCSGIFVYSNEGQNIVKMNEHRKDCPYGKSKTGCIVTLIDNAIALLKEHNAVKPDTDFEGNVSCGNCGTTVGYYPAGCSVPEKFCRFCPECGQEVEW